MNNFKCSYCGEIRHKNAKQKGVQEPICKGCFKKLDPETQKSLRTLRLKCATCGRVERGWWRRNGEWECIRCLRRRANKTVPDGTTVGRLFR